MKTSQVSALLLPLSLAGPALALAKHHKQKEPTVHGGNTVTNTYEFKNDKFGNGDVLNLQATSQVGFFQFHFSTSGI